MLYLGKSIYNHWSDMHFEKGWVKRKGYGKTKGRTYITEFYKTTIEQYFQAGEEDKGGFDGRSGLRGIIN